MREGMGLVSNLLQRISLLTPDLILSWCWTLCSLISRKVWSRWRLTSNMWTYFLSTTLLHSVRSCCAIHSTTGSISLKKRQQRRTFWCWCSSQPPPAPAPPLLLLDRVSSSIIIIIIVVIVIIIVFLVIYVFIIVVIVFIIGFLVIYVFMVVFSSETWCRPPPATPMATRRNCYRGWSSQHQHTRLSSLRYQAGQASPSNMLGRSKRSPPNRHSSRCSWDRNAPRPSF